jgi:hypothetical protein
MSSSTALRSANLSSASATRRRSSSSARRSASRAARQASARAIVSAMEVRPGQPHRCHLSCASLIRGCVRADEDTSGPRVRAEHELPHAVDSSTLLVPQELRIRLLGQFIQGFAAFRQYAARGCWQSRHRNTRWCSLKLLQQLARDVVAAASEASLRSGVFQKLPPCLVSLVGIEACASSHYWARELQALGHRVLPGRPSPA